MKLRKTIAALLVLMVFLPLYGQVSLAADYDAYLYSFDGKYKKSTPVYTPERVVDLVDITKDTVTRPSDMVCDAQGNIYVCDSGKNRILLLDKDYKLIQIISEAADLKNNTKITFNNPMGIFVDSKANLYVADTENGRIVVLDKDHNLKDVFTPQKGDTIPEEFAFKPVSIVSDESGRMFVVSQASNLGIVSLSANGEFEGFLGAQIATPTASELFGRLFMTKAQIERTAKIIPVEYSNIAIDREGFVFVTSSALDKNLQYNALFTRSKTSDYAPVKRLNPEGKDVLRRAGFYPPAGDLDVLQNVPVEQAVSAFGDVAIDSTGVFCALDINQNKLFAYDSNGNLLNVFGGTGIQTGRFSKAAAVCYSGEKLLVLDASTGRITEFVRSSFGQQVYAAIGLQNDRKYKEALDAWETLAKSNANLDFVYINMGKSYMKQEQYAKAMEYFKLVNDKDDYSKAFKFYRNSLVKKAFLLIPVFLVLAIWLLMRLFGKAKKENKQDSITPNLKVTVRKELTYALYTLFHPLDGFYDAKRYHRGGIRGALILFAAAVVAITSRTYLSAFAFTSADAGDNTVITGIARIVLPVLLFCVANWCASSFMYGEGRFKDIFITASYSLVPIVLIVVPVTIMTHFVTLEEGQILFLFENTAYLWTIFLLFFGTLTIHGYSPAKNLLSTVFSILGMVVIIFLMILFIALFQKCYAFLENLFTEILFRF